MGGILRDLISTHRFAGEETEAQGDGKWRTLLGKQESGCARSRVGSWYLAEWELPKAPLWIGWKWE